MEDYFVQCDDVEPSLFTLLKVEDDEIIDLPEIFKEEVQFTLDLSIEPNSMIEFVQENQVKETPITIDMIMCIHIENNKVILEKDLAAKIKFIGSQH